MDTPSAACPRLSTSPATRPVTELLLWELTGEIMVFAEKAEIVLLVRRATIWEIIAWLRQVMNADSGLIIAGRLSKKGGRFTRITRGTAITRIAWWLVWQPRGTR